MKNKYEIIGEITYILIKRRKGLSVRAMIDTEDLRKVDAAINGSWCLTDTGYVVVANVSEYARLHRVIMDNPEGKDIDHISHDKLDNRKENLRIATRSENMQNRKGVTKRNTSGVRGVSWHKQSQKWAVNVGVNGKLKYIGYFTDLEEAAQAAAAARKELMPFSKENIPSTKW